jgi:hypothetical protein
MINKYSPSRCCCPDPELDDSCPCLAGTFAAGVGNTVAVSGVTDEDFAIDTIGMETVNRSLVTADSSNVPFCVHSKTRTNTISPPDTIVSNVRFDVIFTRQSVWVVRNVQQFALSAGLKVLIQIANSLLQRLTQTQIFTGGTTALFEKVVAGVDGFTDCSASFSGFTFVGQASDGTALGSPNNEYFDASGATVSYT